jgi:hypothetical protein
MKFCRGDATDKQLVIGLQHEFFRCHDAFQEFASRASTLILAGTSREASYRTYNAYARFIHHLYEFLVGAVKRDRQDTATIQAVDAERTIQREAERALAQRREGIIKGYAPSWENDLRAYPISVPTEFAREFRRHRNITLGHVTVDRHSLSLSRFYADFHPFLYMIYSDARFSWGTRSAGFPDLQEITDFSVIVETLGAPAPYDEPKDM